MSKDFTTDLGLEAQRIILSLRDVEDLDGSEFDEVFGHQHQRADYLFMDRTHIIEHKEIIVDRDGPVNDWLNEQAKTDAWLAHSWFGRVPAEEIIRKHPNSKEFRERLLRYVYRNLENDVFKKAAKQLHETEELLNISAQKILFLSITTDKAITAEGVRESLYLFFRRNSDLAKKVDIFVLLSASTVRYSKYKLEVLGNPFAIDPKQAENNARFLLYQIAARAKVPIAKEVN